MKSYSNTAARTAISMGAGISDSSTSLVLDSQAGYPTAFPFTLRLEPGTVEEELVDVTAGLGTSGTPYTIVRGVGSTTAKAHLAGAIVSHGVDARDFFKAEISVLDYYAVGDDATDNTTALNAAIAALPSTGGTLRFPAGIFRVSGTLNLSSKINIIITGQGGRTAGAAPATIIKTTSAATSPAGSGGRVLDCRHSFGIQVKDLALTNTNVAFAGTFIDLSWDGTSSGAYHNLENLLVQTTSGQTGAAIGVNLNWSQEIQIDSCHFLGFPSTGAAIRGRADATAQSNSIEVNNCVFHSSRSIVNPGQAWTVSNCTFEGDASDVAGAIMHDTGVTAQGLLVQNCWTGDVTSGTQFKVAGYAIVFHGNWIGCTGGTCLDIDAASEGIDISGNYFTSATLGIHIASTSDGFEIARNVFNDVDTCITHDSPANSSNYAIGRNTFHSYTTIITDKARPSIAIFRDATGPIISITNSDTTSGAATVRFQANRGGAQQYDVGIDAIGGTTKDWQVYNRTTSKSLHRVTHLGSNVLNDNGAALATTATDGFTYIPTCAGTPTGTPTAQAGTVPMVYDTVGLKLWVYVGGAWTAV